MMFDPNPPLSTDMYVAIRSLVLSCNCRSCRYMFTMKYESEVLKLTGKYEHYSMPKDIECPECSRTTVDYTISSVKKSK